MLLVHNVPSSEAIRIHAILHPQQIPAIPLLLFDIAAYSARITSYVLFTISVLPPCQRQKFRAVLLEALETQSHP